MNKEYNMDSPLITTRELIRRAKRQVLECFVGIAVHSIDAVTTDGENASVVYIRRFNRKVLLNGSRKRSRKSNTPGDLSIIRTGRPGSRKRLEAYAAFYQLNGCADNKYDGTISPFMETEN